MITEAELNDVFQETGKHFGFLTVKVEFAEFSEFKIKWQRGHNWIDMRISDYLKDAPIEVLEDLAVNTFRRIAGNDEPYGKHMIAYVLDNEFARKNRPTFLKRMKHISGDPDGEFVDLNKIYKKLVKDGLLEDLQDEICLTWAADDYELITHSILMKVAAISYLLDSESTPDEVAEAAVHEAVQRIRIGQKRYRNGTREKGWKPHPSKKELEIWLRDTKMSL